ncbi:polyketide synthase dehydratase domain-containing protein, partial [Streptomyces tirandamycinicus]|uniref:polyketide synthase dehydratase domain-containing protein n=1 Tax=Streptomyces tirandamycinicus TaxID=2174846 RepID=UPI003429E115
AEDEVVPYLSGGVVVAAVNGPSSVVVSGVEEAVLAVAARFEGEGRRVSRLRVSHAFHSPLMEPMLDDFRAVVTGLSLGTPRIPVVSNLTGAVASPEDIASAEYWVRHVREAVRFSDGIRALRAEGVTRFLELGPDGVLSAMAAESLPDGEAVLVPLLRKGRSEEAAVVDAVARVHTDGGRVDWAAYFTGTGARRVDLPTYAFQHRRYWVNATTGTGDLSASGVQPLAHPLLGAVVRLPESDGVVLTGRLSLATHPWLADHAVRGVVLVPGSGLVELVVRAGDEVGHAVLEELALAAPLVLPQHGAVQIQVVVGPEDPEDDGRRTVAVYSRAEGEEEAAWLRHASGFLATAPRGAGAGPAFDLSVWPPEGAEPVRVDDAYETLRTHGYGYGPAFQGLRAVWRAGQDLYAEVALPEGMRDEAARFGLHPALLDAAMHAAILVGDAEETVIPFAWNDVTLHAVGASAVRVRLERTDSGGLVLEVADPAGRPVLSVGSMVGRPVSAEQLGSAGGSQDAGALYGVEWSVLASVDSAEVMWADWDVVSGVGSV